MMEGLRTPTELIVTVVVLLSYRYPIQAIVHVYGLDERTVADWQKRAGKHCQQVHQAIVEQGKVETHHVQADEIRAIGRKIVAWMGMAIDATISQGVRAFGMRRSHYIGLPKTHLQHFGIAAAINVVCVVAWLDGDELAPTNVSAYQRLYYAA